MKKLKIMRIVSFALIGGAALASFSIATTSCGKGGDDYKPDPTKNNLPDFYVDCNFPKKLLYGYTSTKFALTNNLSKPLDYTGDVSYTINDYGNLRNKVAIQDKAIEIKQGIGVGTYWFSVIGTANEDTKYNRKSSSDLRVEFIIDQSDILSTYSIEFDTKKGALTGADSMSEHAKDPVTGYVILNNVLPSDYTSQKGTFAFDLYSTNPDNFKYCISVSVDGRVTIDPLHFESNGYKTGLKIYYSIGCYLVATENYSSAYLKIDAVLEIKD